VLPPQSFPFLPVHEKPLRSRLGVLPVPVLSEGARDFSLAIFPVVWHNNQARPSPQSTSIPSGIEAIMTELTWNFLKQRYFRSQDFFD